MIGSNKTHFLRDCEGMSTLKCLIPLYLGQFFQLQTIILGLMDTLPNRKTGSLAGTIFR